MTERLRRLTEANLCIEEPLLVDTVIPLDPVLTDLMYENRNYMRYQRVLTNSPKVYSFLCEQQEKLVNHAHALNGEFVLMIDSTDKDAPLEFHFEGVLNERVLPIFTDVSAITCAGELAARMNNHKVVLPFSKSNSSHFFFIRLFINAHLEAGGTIIVKKSDNKGNELYERIACTKETLAT